MYLKCVSSCTSFEISIYSACPYAFFLAFKMDIDHSCDFSESAVEHEDIPPDPALQEICGSEANTEFSKDMTEVKTETVINIIIIFYA